MIPSRIQTKIQIGCFALLICVFLSMLHFLCQREDTTAAINLLHLTKSKLFSLKKKVDLIDRKSRTLSKDNTDVTLFLITPTYARYTQQADLVRLSYTLKHVDNLHWIVVEDSEVQTKLVRKVLKDSQITYTQLNVKTRKDLQLGENDPRWKKHRGVDQRNHALEWIRLNVGSNRRGVVYFADDDNTYHLDLFSEMRTTRKVSIWPVALVGGLRWEGPICKNGKVVRFFTAWKVGQRAFPVDMAAFAVNLDLIRDNHVLINPQVERGFLESDFLEQLKITRDDLEAKAEDCSKILVWHTQTAKPKMKEEIKLVKRNGVGSDSKIII